jgi:hypothetical protein
MDIFYEHLKKLSFLKFSNKFKVFNSHALPLSRYPIKLLGSITYLLEFGSVLHNLSKT